jgi:hypothetical protein
MTRTGIVLFVALMHFAVVEAQNRKNEVLQAAFTRSILLFTKDIEALDWPRLAKEAGLSTIAIHPGGGHLKATMLPDTTAWVKSEAGQKFLRDCERNGIHVEYELHALRELLPRSLFETHPEYFRVDQNGNRTPDLNLCVHSQEALDVVARNAIAFSRECKPTTSRYFFWLDDGAGGPCHCEQCREYSASEQALLYENYLLAKLRRFDSRATLSHLCYNPTLDAPRPDKVRPAEGVFLEFAPIYRQYDKVYRHQWGSTNGAQHLIANLEVFPRDTAQVLEYWMDISMASQWKRPFKELPWNQQVFEGDLEYYRSIGIRHVASFGNGADRDYLNRYGMPPVMEYGSGLIRNFSSSASSTLVPQTEEQISIDGQLDEPLYKAKPFAALTIAGERCKVTSSTEVWSAWDGEHLVIAFRCEDKTLAGAAASGSERDLDGQDRVEIFVWDGEPNSGYYCIEIGRKGAVHDYSARFYRKFDDSWSVAQGCEIRAVDSPSGYVVETKISKRALLSMIDQSDSDAPFWLGLFRADFDDLNGNPTWITWRDHGGVPDFHIPAAFKKVRLAPQTDASR